MEKYNAAIDLNPEVPTYYCNRAFCHTRMENHGLAIEDAGAETVWKKPASPRQRRRPLAPPGASESAGRPYTAHRAASAAWRFAAAS